MIYSYAFEAKGIQQYLFRTGRLKDVIAASERLDLLVDDSPQSVLNQVLTTAGLVSDLLGSCDPQALGDEQSQTMIHFTRCKGGAFYSLCRQQAPLVKLRSLWTLTVQQMFPSLEFVDALTAGDSAGASIGAALAELKCSRNVPSFKFPIGTVIMDRTRRTGSPRVEQSVYDQFEKEWDIDTDFHRQAYTYLNLDRGSSLQSKFTPEALVGKVKFPTNLDRDFWFSTSDDGRSQQTELAFGRDAQDDLKDLAIIHLDGNGLGNLLRQLHQALANASVEVYCQVWRQFSSAVAAATMEAVKTVNLWLFAQASYQLKADNVDYLPLRPLVLGGDDVTLLCHANWALEYARRFCEHFEQASKRQLATLDQSLAQSLTQSSLSQNGVNPYLTASGGVLFHKAGHAFTHSHRLVEDLTLAAKQLSKKVNLDRPPAALAFFRLSTTTSDDFASVKARFGHFEVKDKTGNMGEMRLGLSAYLLNECGGQLPCWADLKACAALLDQPPMILAKWRQMASYIALGNKTEADAIYQRAIERCNDSGAITTLANAFKQVARCDPNAFYQWYWTLSDEDQDPVMQTVITDLLTYDHFKAKEPLKR